MNFYFDEFTKAQSFSRILKKMGIEIVVIEKNPFEPHRYVVITECSNVAQEEYERIRGGAEVDR